MSADHLMYEWWVEDGHPWVRHLCDGALDEWRLPPPWHLGPDGVPTPSFHCENCGAHTILTAADHVDRVGVTLAERVAAMTQPLDWQPPPNTSEETS